MSRYYSRSSSTRIKSEPLLRFAYAYDRLGTAMVRGHTRPRFWQAKRFRLLDSHGSQINCNNFIELREHFTSPTFAANEITGYFELFEDTLGYPYGQAEFLMTRALTQESEEWDLKISVSGTHEGQILGGLAQVESVLSHVASMEAGQLKEDTAPLFEVPPRGPVRRFFARIVEGVLSNLLSSAVVGAFGIAIGWFAGKSAG
jgi:hypothetical protein